MEMSIQFTARLPVTFHVEGGATIACIPLLDIASSGANRQEALTNVTEALRVWFASCYERGTLESALKECGFHPSQQQELIGSEPDDYVEVPLSLLAAAQNGAEANAN